MDKKNKRILWLLNHTTLGEFEVPLILSLGYEVYTPKQIPTLIQDSSGSVDYSYDQYLSIPKEVLDTLNQHDFYDGVMTPPIAALLNRYFGTVFCLFYPNMLEQVFKRFEGRILLRAFGLDKSTSYGKIFSALGNNLLAQVSAIQDRFWFSQTYTNLHEIEPHILKSRSIDHSLGLPESFYKFQDTWCGGVDKVLFFCARIAAAPTYYGEIYKQFKKQLGDLPHLIAGNQPIAVNDPNVAGRQARTTIDEWLRTYAVMFYHSQEPRHLHYHPLEAIISGMPLIYMRGGLLEQLGGPDQPGACETVAEARKKIKRVLSKDTLFIEELRSTQKAILEKFSLEYVRKEWEENFVAKVMSVEPVSTSITRRIKTIGVFLASALKGEWLEEAKNLAKMIYLGSRESQEAVNVVFSFVAGAYDVTKDFNDLIEIGISTRETTWQVYSKNKIELALVFSSKQSSLAHAEYCLPTDEINNFHDCDFWLVISDRMSHPIAPLKSYGVINYNYLQAAYMPEALQEGFDALSYIATLRSADFVLTNTQSARDKVIQYAGLSSYQVHEIPEKYRLWDNEENFHSEKAELNETISYGDFQDTIVKIQQNSLLKFDCRKCAPEFWNFFRSLL